MNWYEEELQYLRDGLKPTEAIFINNSRGCIEKVFINPQQTLEDIVRMRAKYGWKLVETGKVKNVKVASGTAPVDFNNDKIERRGRKKMDSN